MTEGTPVDLLGARKVAPFAPALLQSTDHHLCSGCGHPVAWRLLVEVLDELNLVDRSIGVVGHGCYTQIITTAGYSGGLGLTLRVLCLEGRKVWMEDPGYHMTRLALETAGARVVPVRVDAEGIRVTSGISAAPRAKLAVVTPFP